MKRLIWLATLSLASLGHAVVHYQIDFQPDAKQVRVTIQLDNPGKAETFHIPAWSPGFYQIARYQTGISHVQALTPDGQALAVQRDGSRGWQVQDPEAKPYSLSYFVEGNDEGLGFFGTAVSDDDGFVNGASAFMYLDARITEPASLKISAPTGWDIATPLDPDAAGEYEAGGYDELIDSPIQVGRFVRKSFTAENLPFQVVYVAPDGHARADLDVETARFAKLVVPAIKMFGGAPFKHYTFFIHLAPGSFSGGLEHRACTVINIQNTNPLNIDDLITHEYFHAWNVKNIRPLVLGPFDYTKEVRTDNLWFAEGVTDYYAKLDAYQSGLDNLGYLFDQFTEEESVLQRTRDRTKYTLAQASRGAWEGGSEGLGDLSYYDKGLLVGLFLDAEIRSATHGEKSLDDVMRLLYERHHLPLPGYAEDEIRSTVSEVAGTDLKSIYDVLVYSTKEVPYKELQKLGIRAIEANVAFQDPGFHVDPSGRITDLRDALKGQGLALGDAMSLENLDGDKAKYSVLRGHLSFHVTVTVKSVLGDHFEIEPDPLASAEASKLRDEWLKR
jgi:predicted metalloprotease with PDZ domain